MEEGQRARDKPAHCEGRTGREKHDRRTNHPIFGYGVTPSVLLWFRAPVDGGAIRGSSSPACRETDRARHLCCFPQGMLTTCLE